MKCKCFCDLALYPVAKPQILDLNQGKPASCDGTMQWSSRRSSKAEFTMSNLSTISQYLEQDHQHCDDLYMQAEEHVAETRLAEGAAAFQRFMLAFELHLAREEHLLFPELEKHLGNQGGPTVVMRHEHEQMRAILRQMLGAIEHADIDSFFDDADHLRMLMRQHNLKEENVLYPMADRLLGEHSASMLDQLARSSMAGLNPALGVAA